MIPSYYIGSLLMRKLCPILSPAFLLLVLTSLICLPSARLAASQVVVWGDQINVPGGLSNVVAVAAGANHNLALKSDGTVIAWGDDTYGQTDVPLDLAGVVGIGAGLNHSLAIKSDGTVVAWGAVGYGGYGQTSVPLGLSNVVAVSGGPFHSLALKNDGTVVSWGLMTTVPGGLTATAIAAGPGPFSSTALTSNGSLINWGMIGVAPPAGLSNVIAITMSPFSNPGYGMAVKIDGTVVSWGSAPASPANFSNVVVAAASSASSLTLMNDGSLFAWGDNTYGQTNIPVGLSNVVAIAAGANHFLAIVSSPPVITSLSSNQTNYSGTANTFTVAALGAPFTYQWQFKGTNIDGATGASLNLTNIQASNAGSYQVVVSNSSGAVTSSNITLTVIDSAPIISVSPTNQTVLGGATATFTASVTGDLPMSYQWLYNGTNIYWATNSALTLTNIQPGQAGVYSIVVSNQIGATTNSSAVLNVVPSIITSQPQSQSVGLGSNVSFSVTASGQGPFSYQWQFQNTNLDGATNSTLVLTNVQRSQSGVYAVTVSNVFGTVTSSNANLAVVGIVVWGNFGYGNLPLTNVPVSATNVIVMAAGDTHCLALKADGTVVAWGSGGFGQINVPLDVTNAVSIAAGSTHSLALRNNGTVTMWGRIMPSGINAVPPDATNIAGLALGPGAQHALVLKADGTVLDWGNNNYGLTNTPALARDVVAVASGATYCLALRADGKVVTWGSGQFGAVTPVPAAATNIVAIATSWYGNAALRSDGTLLVWGYINSPLSSFTNILDVVCPINSFAGNSDVLALRRNGTLVESSGSVPKYPTNTITAIAAGSYNAFAVVGNGPPVFPGMPVNRTVAAGSSAYFRAVAAGTMPISYQWNVNGTNISGATNTVLVLTNVQPNLAGNYYSLIASNAFGVTTNGAMLLNEVPLEFSIQPAAISTSAGATAKFSVTNLIGVGPFTYQWQCNSANIDGATNASLSLTNVQVGQSGNYSVVVTNAFGTITNCAMLAVQPFVFNNGSTSLLFTTNGLQLQLNGVYATNSVILYASTDLVSWLPILTNAATTGSAKFVDSAATNWPQRFYRATEQ